MLKKTLFIINSLLFSSVSFAQVAPPTMGWSSWNTFSVNISENIIKGQADAMVDQGLADVGYKYINIDDGFQGGRDENGKLKINPTRFPNGLKVVSDYIHSKGLKAGIYSDAGACTCGSLYNNDVLSTNVGFYGHDQQDADFYFKENEFDFIKVDYCGGDKLSLNEKDRYSAISQAIKNTGRDVRYNLCRWAYPGTWCHDISSSWRTTGDIYDGWASVKGILDENLYLSAYCYGGCYNDMDMLEVGRSMTAEEDKTHFGMWCIMSSPLLIGCNMETIKERPLTLLKNEDLIAINQDPLGLQAHVVQHQGETYVLVKDIMTLNGTTRAVALYNPSDNEALMTISFDDLDLGGIVKVRDLFEHKDLGEINGALSVLVPAHGTRIYRLDADKRLEQYLYEAETAYLSEYQEIYNNEAIGTAVYQGNSSASGGMSAGWLGSRATNDMQWRNVYSLEGGDYIMKISCATQENRSFTVQVNGTDVKTVTANTGAWGTFGVYEVPVHLDKGINVVRLYNGSAWMPNIDYMELHRQVGDDVTARRLQSACSRLKQTAAANNITPGFQSAISNLINASKAAGMTETQQADMTTQLTSMINNVVQALPLCNDYAVAKEYVNKNVAVSEASDALTTLNSKIESADNTFSTADTYTLISKALLNLNTAIKTYLRDATSMPKAGESFDMAALIVNPDFSTTSGWLGSPTYRSGCGEEFNKTFDMNQVIYSMKPGVYTIRVNALYRPAANDGGVAYKDGTEIIPAKFYVNTVEKPVQSLYSYDWQNASNYGHVDNDKGYANSMYAAGLCFEQGAYQNEIIYTLNAKGSLTIGLRCADYVNDCWCCFDNFTITYQPLPIPDGIKTVLPTTMNDSASYDIQGRKVSANQKGIVISKGSKHLNK